jgi:hypothetical protein
MRNRTALATVLVGALLLSGTGTALASADEAPSGDPPAAELAAGLASFQAEVADRIEARIAVLERIVERFEGSDGSRARRAVAYAEAAIAIHEEALAGVRAAATAGEVVEAVSSLREGVRARARVRRLHVHVETDLARFSRSLERLENAIDRAGRAGVPAAAAAAEAGEAAADLEEAGRLLDGVDASQRGPEVVDALAEAHRTAHAARRHVRSGLEALFEALLPEAG